MEDRTPLKSDVDGDFACYEPATSMLLPNRSISDKIGTDLEHPISKFGNSLSPKTRIKEKIQTQLDKNIDRRYSLEDYSVRYLFRDLQMGEESEKGNKRTTGDE